MGLDILGEIAGRARARVAEKKSVLPLEKIKEQAEMTEAPGCFSFEAALRSAGGMAFICEVKRASPSKGLIAEWFPYGDIAREYEAAGASAVSVLTEPYYFRGEDRYLTEISGIVSLPLLRKDFTVDPYMIYEAKVLGASAVLLICALLDAETLAGYIALARRLGLSALVEAHDENEIKTALAAGARVIGVNNRDLKTFEVDINLSQRLRRYVPPEILFVSESGVRTPEDIARLRENGVDAVLVGETLMRGSDKRSVIAWLRGGKS